MRIALVAFLSLILSIAIFEFSEAAVNLFSISISGPATPVGLSQKINIGITVTNLSNDTLHAFAGKFMDFNIEVHDDRGGIVPYTARAKRELGDPSVPCCASPNSGRDPRFNLEPGDTYKSVVPISDIFELSRPGIYTVQVSNFPSDKSGFGIYESDEVEHSNVLMLRIVE